MKIAITLDEVIRDTFTQLHFIYEKYVQVTEIDYNEIDTTDFSKYFYFGSKELYNKFLYESASNEIFGFADAMRVNMFEAINDFLYDFYADNLHEIVWVSKEHGRSTPATLFFLSKLGVEIRNVSLVDNYSEIWDKYDVIITATPDILESKPENKISIKVEAPYNKNSVADHTVKNVEDLFKEHDKFYDKLKK